MAKAQFKTLQQKLSFNMTRNESLTTNVTIKKHSKTFEVSNLNNRFDLILNSKSSHYKIFCHFTGP